jgi:RNA-directed DNA polymerase
MHPAKTKIVYCKDEGRTGTHDHTKFTFLGYEFRQRYVKSAKTGRLFVGFTAAVSPEALTAMRQKARRLSYRNRTDLSLQDIARTLNPILRGWIAYYGRFQPSALGPLFRHINMSLVAWAMRKYKRFHKSKTRAGGFINEVSRKCPKLFAHWQLGMASAVA